MKKTAILLLLTILSASFYFITSCRHELPLSCTDLNFKITATKTDAVLNNANGTISVTAEGGSHFEYSLNGGAFRDTGYFPGLEPFKEYRVVGHNSMGCSDTAVITIGSIDPAKELLLV
jgi:hypothetical protein